MQQPPPPPPHGDNFGPSYGGTGAGRGATAGGSERGSASNSNNNSGTGAGAGPNNSFASASTGYPDSSQQQGPPGSSRRYTLSAAPGGNPSPSSGNQQQVPVHDGNSGGLAGGAGGGSGADAMMGAHSQRSFRGGSDMPGNSPHNPGGFADHQLSPTHLAHRMSLGFYPMSGGGSAASPNFGSALGGDPLDLSGRSAIPPSAQGGPPGSGGPGGGGGATTQAEREEELLLNLLIARRQRGRMTGDGKGGKNPQSLADELMRLRQSRSSSQQPPQQQQQQHHQQQQNHPHQQHHQQQHRGSLPQLPGMPPLYSDSMSPVGGGGGGSGNIVAPNMMYTDAYHRATSMKADYPVHHHHQMARPMQDMVERIDRSPGRFQMSDARMDLSDRTVGFKRSMGSMGMGGHGGGMGMGMMMGPGHPHHPGHHPHHHHPGMGNMGAVGAFDNTGMSMGYQQNPMEMQGLEIPPTKKKRTHKKKPADMPRRPLSAYNLFFSEERERILKEIEKKEGKAAGGDDAEGKDKVKKEEEKEEEKPKALLRPLIPSQKKRRPHRKTHGKISFQQLARMVGERWKSLPDDDRKYYQDLAQEDMKRQKVAMEEYYAKQNAKDPSSVVKPVDGVTNNMGGDRLAMEQRSMAGDI